MTLLFLHSLLPPCLLVKSKYSKDLVGMYIYLYVDIYIFLITLHPVQSSHIKGLLHVLLA